MYFQKNIQLYLIHILEYSFLSPFFTLEQIDEILASFATRAEICAIKVKQGSKGFNTRRTDLWFPFFQS